jgi:hypothetical protein
LQTAGKWDRTKPMSYLRAGLAAALLVLSAGVVRAQQANCFHRVIPVHVAMRDGAAPPRLTQANFVATVADKPVRLMGLSGARRPQRLVVLLDASGSVRGGTTAGWEATVQVAAELLANMPPLEVALALFSEEVEAVAGPTTDRERLLEEIERLRTGPREFERGRRQRTAIWDSLLDSITIFGPFRAGDVFYIITDGVDNFSETRPAAVTQALVSTGIRLFAFAIANEGFAYGSGDLERMVDDTGGGVAAGSPRDWRAFKAAQESSPIGTALYAQYRHILDFHQLDIELPETVTRPQVWNLTLTGLAEDDMKNLELSYPLRLFPCN